MPTISENLLQLDQIRRSLRNNILTKNGVVPPGTPFADYAAKIAEIEASEPDDDPDVWERPADWLPVPEPLTNELYILVAVYQNSENRLITDISPNGGTLITDWGDGTSDNNSGQRTKTYNYSDLPPESESTRGYRQALIKITCELGIGRLDVNRLTAGLASSTAGILEIKGKIPDCYSLTLTANSLIAGQTLPLLEHVDLEVGNLNTFQISYLYSVKHLRLRINSINVGSVMTGSLFRGLYQVKTIDLNTATAFNGVTSASSMFQDCHNLRSIVLEPNSFNQLTSASGMFRNCYRLKTCVFGANSLILCNGFTDMFSNCFQLQTFTFPEGSLTRPSTTLSTTFSTCYNLTSISFPINGLATVSSMSSTFQDCISLTSVVFPANAFTGLNVALTSTFRRCTKLVNVTFLSTPRISSITGIFRDCFQLETVLMNQHPSVSITSASDAFGGCKSLSSVLGLRLNTDLSLIDGALSALSLNALYTSLPTVTITRTLTVSGNYGTTQAAHNPSIATAKNWIVTT